MGLNDVPSSERVHIAFFGIRNAGKSSLVNAVTGQEMSLVSDVKGTTTDPVKKAMEILPIGPVLIIDTPGIDDTGELGEKRAGRARRVLEETDIAVLVSECGRERTAAEEELLTLIKDRGIPAVIAYTKADIHDNAPEKKVPGSGGSGIKSITVSAKTGHNIKEFRDLLSSFDTAEKERKKRIVGDLLEPGDMVVLVIPIDESAPKGRLILPQQQTIRDILESGCSAVVCRDTELESVLSSLPGKPKMVITDSQAYKEVSKVTPEDVFLTSFSVLFARYKGNLEALREGAGMLSRLRDGDRVLIAEGCTHHRQCNDIGSVKLPKWIREFSGAEPEFSYSSGNDFPEDLSGYSLIVHCGGCMLNEAEMKYRVKKARENGVPIVNYGMAIACMNGILQRSLEVFEMN
ncbi:MAG: [FeFe] hydrogenase H-cluster maturation GTPase HydF [Lachnospiraceae bacterium]|nr:[FeFe] hydrogenase H-cluster maturation GTPase HydF [Lachnospiraceae bacterium]